MRRVALGRKLRQFGRSCPLLVEQLLGPVTLAASLELLQMLGR